MIGYRKTLERDLKRWLEMGIIGPEAAGAIRADVAARGGGISLAPVLATLGAVLLCFAAMTFVAANWQEMPKLARLALLFTGLWGSYGLAWLLQRAAMPLFAETAVLLGASLFGAAIMLIAQMYHIEGNPPDAVLTWAGGSLLAGVLLRSRPALALTVGLVSLWSWWEVVQADGGVHLPFLAGWLACAAAIVWLRWRSGYHLLAISLAAWIIGLGYQLDFSGKGDLEVAHLLVVVAGLAIIAAGLFLRGRGDGLSGFADPLAAYGLVVACAGLFALQFIEETSVAGILGLAILSFLLILGALAVSMRVDNRALTRVAYALFSAELLALYFKTLGTLLDTALFFFIAGLIVVALARLAWRLNRARPVAGGASS